MLSNSLKTRYKAPQLININVERPNANPMGSDKEYDVTHVR